jgi:hypothetical protein
VTFHLPVTARKPSNRADELTTARIFQNSMAAKSVDMARLIRRSLRCFLFGLIGTIPVIGLGLAYQAIRLHQKAAADMGESWQPPRVRWHWTLGLLCLWGYDYFLGWLGFLAIFVIFAWLQTNHVRRGFSVNQDRFWNPAERHSSWGVTLAYGGYFSSLSLVAFIALRLVSVEW